MYPVKVAIFVDTKMGDAVRHSQIGNKISFVSALTFSLSFVKF